MSCQADRRSPPLLVPQSWYRPNTRLRAVPTTPPQRSWPLRCLAEPTSLRHVTSCHPIARQHRHDFDCMSCTRKRNRKRGRRTRARARLGMQHERSCSRRAGARLIETANGCA